MGVIFCVFLVLAWLQISSAVSSMLRSEANVRIVSPLKAPLERHLKGETADHLYSVESSVRPSFEVLPKNAVGHIPVKEVLPGMIRNYFLKEHGWVLAGLEPGVHKMTNVMVLRTLATDVVDGLTSLHQLDGGMSLTDVVGLITVLERLIAGSFQQVLVQSYEVFDIDAKTVIGQRLVRKVLLAFLIQIRLGDEPRDANKLKVSFQKAQNSSSWGRSASFIEELVEGVATKPGDMFDFSAVEGIARSLVMKYGKWQNSECITMKTALVNLATSSTSGVVMWDMFHSAPVGQDYQFTESLSYLIEMGIADPSTGAIRIPNYVLGPSNCIARQGHVKTCCLSECEAIFSEIQAAARKPYVEVDDVLQIMAHMAKDDALFELSKSAVTDLHRSAALVGGSLALHSAVFLEWMHKAFPNECPHLTSQEAVAEDSEMRVAALWAEGNHECSRVPDWRISAEENPQASVPVVKSPEEAAGSSEMAQSEMSEEIEVL